LHLLTPASLPQDPSRLTDICRQTVVFNDVAALLACLRAIRADPEARVLRVKNRLDPAYDARPSAGYRDVALNLRLESPQASGAFTPGLQLVYTRFTPEAGCRDVALSLRSRARSRRVASLHLPCTPVHT
jgi:hypothetical protein